MIGAFLSVLSVVSSLTFFSSLVALFALRTIGKYEKQRRHERKVELIRRLSISSKKARRSSKARSMMLQKKSRLLKSQAITSLAKSGILVVEQKFRRAFKLSIVIPDDSRKTLPKQVLEDSLHLSLFGLLRRLK